MLYIQNQALTPILSFISRKFTYADVLLDLYQGTDILLEVGDTEVQGMRDIIVLSDNYYVRPDILTAWWKRLSKGKLNVSIYDGSKKVFCYHSSNFSENRVYDVKMFPEMMVIDYDFILDRYQMFRSRAKNNVEVINDVIIKKSTDISKIIKEYRFLERASKESIFYLPVFDLEVCENYASYKMPLIVPGDISSYYLNNNTGYFLESKFEEFCQRYFQSSLSYDAKPHSVHQLKNKKDNTDYIAELHARMDKRHKEMGAFVTSNPSANSTLKMQITELHNLLHSVFGKLFSDGHFDFIRMSPVGMFHGDFCLSNILYDEQSKGFFLIDPRGDENLPICFDLAKLSHSLIGNYDNILAGKYYISLTSDGLNLNLARNPFFTDLFNRILEAVDIHSFKQVRLLEAYLFMTMIIFHKDDLQRCLAFLINSRDILASLPIANYLEAVEIA